MSTDDPRPCATDRVPSAPSRTEPDGTARPDTGAHTGADTVHLIPLSRLLPADLPRLDGVDEHHIQCLAESGRELPPLLVDRATLRVVDGMHRLRAAALRGRQEIEVTYFDGSRDEAFLRAVGENIAHGLPLSLSDRKAAARRILAVRPQWSDRAVAAHAGLSGKTVSAIRRRSAEEAPRLRSAEESPHLNSRIGADGRRYPLDGSAGRLRASQLISARPDTPLRAIARDAGVSVGTAHDVRRQLFGGEEPGPGRTSGAPGPDTPEGPKSAADRLALLRSLSQDPSLQNTRTGRELLRWLHTQAVTDDDWQALTATVPAHCVDAVVELARQCAQTWQRIADDVARPKESAVERAVTSAIRSMRENLGEELTIDALAETAMFSRFHFTRVFKNMTGLSPVHFLSALRLQEAKKLLVGTELNIADISNVVGYRSIGSFSTRFKSSVGLAPVAYRRLGGFAEEINVSDGGDEPGALPLSVRGSVLPPASGPAGCVLVGLFPDPVPRGRPVRCALLDHPGAYALENVPEGTWYVLAQSVPYSRDGRDGRDGAEGGDGGGVPAVPCVGASEPVTVALHALPSPVDVQLRPVNALDPPELLALLDVRTTALRTASG